MSISIVSRRKESKLHTVIDMYKLSRSSEEQCLLAE